MKYLLSFLFAFSCIECNYAQTDTELTDCVFYIDSATHRKIYTFVDKMPDYKNKNGFLFHLAASIVIDSIPDNIDTKGAISFIVEPNGKVSNNKIIDTISSDVDKQVIKFIGKTNQWEAGLCNGMAVPVEMKIPYQFDYK